MKRIHIHLPLPVPNRLYGLLHRSKRTFAEQTPNLRGDRNIEWSWIAAHLPKGPGEALDFGSGDTMTSLIAAQKGFRVTALDLEPHFFYWAHPNLQFVQGDLLALSFPPQHLDLVINCSTVEHVGLRGRYGIRRPSVNGDLLAMQYLRELMKPGAIMLCTIPVGRDSVFEPAHRVYGEERLPRLLKGYRIECADCWVKDEENRWVPAPMEKALSFTPFADPSCDPLKTAYALGCFKLVNLS
ncbi:MAG: DUF268 domain-containing protein [Acidobacteria bacterium]|nr:DUF268 domain-containing protein [Acidobacteriota bacterium]